MKVLRMFGMILDQKCNIIGGTVCLRVIVWDSVTSEHTLFLTCNTKSKSGLLVSFGKKTAISWAGNCIDIIKVLPGHVRLVQCKWNYSKQVVKQQPF